MVLFIGLPLIHLTQDIVLLIKDTQVYGMEVVIVGLKQDQGGETQDLTTVKEVLHGLGMDMVELKVGRTEMVVHFLVVTLMVVTLTL